jgi:hypothetical protein
MANKNKKSKKEKMVKVPEKAMTAIALIVESACHIVEYCDFDMDEDGKPTRVTGMDICTDRILRLAETIYEANKLEDLMK